MRVVYKYDLLGPNVGGTQIIPMPVGAEILKVGVQGHGPVIWALIDVGHMDEPRTFTVVGTGHQSDLLEGATYIGTFEELGGALVWHLFEVEGE